MLAAGALKRLVISLATVKASPQLFAATSSTKPRARVGVVDYDLWPYQHANTSTLSRSNFCIPANSIPIRTMADGKVQLSEEEWRMKLTPQQFKVLRQNGTEPAGSGEYNKCKEQGVYKCAACDAPLYTSETKFDSGCGWPAFFAAVPGALTYKEDRTFGMHRIEMRCAKCDSHLGHVFRGEGFKNPVDERHCVNSVSLKLDKNADPKDFKWQSYGDKPKN